MQLAFHSYGTGLPLIILHGLLGSSDNWHTLSRKFAEHFHVFAIDQRNHGRSPHSDKFSYDIMAQDIKEFMEQHGLSSAFLLGHSMGGKTAMTLALGHPAKASKLIVVDIAPKSYGAQHDYIFNALYGLKLVDYQSRKQIDDALAKTIPSFSTRQFLMKNLIRNESGGFMWRINLDVIYRHYDELNREIRSEKTFKNPTLFIRGGKSGYLEENDSDSIKRLFPHAALTSIADAGHWVHADEPEKFSRVVLDFLQNQS